jgi:hypothetical protein
MSKSYPEMLHELFEKYNDNKEIPASEKNLSENKISNFESSIINLIDNILETERKKLCKRNDDIKVGCESCSWHNTVTDCGLTESICINNNKFTKYRKVHLLPCDRCKTYSVVTTLDKILDKNTGNILKPVLKFFCLKCNDSPIIGGTTFRGYELKGLRFTSKYLKIFKAKQAKYIASEKEQTKSDESNKSMNKSELEIKSEGFDKSFDKSFNKSSNEINHQSKEKDISLTTVSHVQINAAF